MVEEKELTPNKCNFCNELLQHRFIDVVVLPANSRETRGEPQHLIHTYICDCSFLVQIGTPFSTDSTSREYITSYSPIWLSAMKEYAKGIFTKMELTSKGFALELIDHGLMSEQTTEFPIAALTKKDVYSFIEMYGRPDRIVCHNEMAYSNDINAFVAAIKLLLKPEGTITMEFPHLLRFMEGERFANLVSGVFTYFSFTTIDIIFKSHRLVIFDAEECLPQGCIRISAKHQENVSRHISRNTPALRGRERDRGMSSLAYYMNFKSRMESQEKSLQNI